MKFVSLIFAIVILFSCNENSRSAKQITSGDSIVSTKVNGSILPLKEKFDTVVDGVKNSLYFLSNKNNFKAAVTNYGARMVAFILPDKNGTPTEVVLGFDNIHNFITGSEKFFGAIVGRYGNRIAKGKFALDGKNYQLDLNNGVNTLHGGKTGFFSRMWSAIQPDSQTVILTYISKDGEEGYPGTMTTKVTYKLTDDNELHMDYEITTDKKTICNITNHNYWNLNGEGSGSINKHGLMIKAAKYTPVDSTLIPTSISAVANTPFDFTTTHLIGERIDADNLQLKYGKGYDHNYVLDKGMTITPELIATVKADMSGIVMDIFTTEPGVQFYGGNFMQSKNTLKNGSKDDFRTAFCLETQHFPDAPNQPSFPTTVLLPGQVYKSTTIHKFSVSK